MKIQRLLPVLSVFALLAAPEASAQTEVTIRVTDQDSNILPDIPITYVDMHGVERKAVPIDGGMCVAYEAGGKFRFTVEDFPNAGEIDLAFVLPNDPEMLVQVMLDGDGQAMLRFPRYEQRKMATAAALVPLGVAITGAPFGPTLTSGPLAVGPPAPVIQFASNSCANAPAIFGDGVFAYTTTLQSTDGPPEPGCNFFGNDQLNNDVWYCWTAPCTGAAELLTLNLTPFNRIAVYDGCACPAQDPLTCGESQPLFPAGGFATFLTWNVVQGNQYLIRIGDLSDALGIFTAGAFGITCIPAPPNDECVDGIDVAVPSLTFGTTRGGSLDAPPCPGAGSITAPGVWYTFTGTGNSITIDTCGPTTAYDTKLNLYCGPCDALTCIDSNDDACILSSAITFCSEAGAIYRVLVHGFDTHRGDFELAITDSGTPCDDPVACIGACCDGDDCDVIDHSICAANGGTYQGNDTDCCGEGIYELETCLFDFQDITATGTQIGIGDDAGVSVPLGFFFDFFGEGKSQVTISSNGYLTFGTDGDDFSNDPIPTITDPNDLIAPLWTDFSPNLAGSVHYETLGAPGDRVFIAQWTDVPQFGEVDANTFQVKLFEDGGCIEFHYGAITPEGFPGDYTVGVENPAGNNGLAIDAMTLGAGNTCVRICPRGFFPCNCNALVLGDEDKIKFSDIDGGLYDLDNAVNGKVELCDLDMTGNSEIAIDVDYAVFEIFDDLDMSGQARIVDTTPDHAATIRINVCDNVSLSENAYISSNGLDQGGSIYVCAGDDMSICDVAHIEAEAIANVTGLEQGGVIELETRYNFELKTPYTYLSAEGPKGGSIEVTACGGSPTAIKVEGDIQANGLGAQGCGGYVTLNARQGGAYVDYYSIGAAGALLDGEIGINTALGLQPYNPPFTMPDAILGFGFDPEPCDCEDED